MIYANNLCICASHENITAKVFYVYASHKNITAKELCIYARDKNSIAKVVFSNDCCKRKLLRAFYKESQMKYELNIISLMVFIYI